MAALKPGSPLHSIQVLRGLTALGVAIAHLHAVESKFGGDALLGNWALTGFAGVDLFFVISGFVMVWVTRPQQGRFEALPRFWFSRAARIYPLWWLVLTAIVGVWLVQPEWVYGSHTHQPNILRSYLLFPDNELPLHAVGWTLVHEVYFYIVFGSLLALPRAYLPAALVAWAACVAAGALVFPQPDVPLLALVRHPLTIEFVLGAAIGLLACRMKLVYARHMLSAGLIWLCLAAASTLPNPPDTFVQEWPRVVQFGLPAAMIIYGGVGLEMDWQKAPGWGVRLGDWSYALYLIHVPVFAGLGRLAAPLSREGPLDNLALLIVALAAAIAAAALLHIGFEKPVGRGAKAVIRLFSSRTKSA